MAFKEKIVTAAFFVSSLFGGGAKVAAAEKTDTTQETNIEVTVNQENDQKEETSKDNNSNLVDPKLPSPTQYVMNAKLLDFCSRHDNLSKKILEIHCKK